MGSILGSAKGKAPASLVVKIVWTEGAVANLDAIRNYIEATNSTETAHRVVQQIFYAVENLAMFPNSGRAGRVPGIRELVVPPFVIAYRVRSGAIEVIRVLHGSQRWPESFD